MVQKCTTNSSFLELHLLRLNFQYRIHIQHKLKTHNRFFFFFSLQLHPTRLKSILTTQEYQLNPKSPLNGYEILKLLAPLELQSP